MTSPAPHAIDRSAAPRHDALRTASVLLIGLACLAGGCRQAAYRPDLAAPTYPMDRHRTTSVDVQVFREDTSILVVNATPRSFDASTMWLNQRWAREVESIPAGAVRRISLWGFRDDRGNLFNAGGFFRTERSDPLRLVQLELPGDQPLVGFVVAREGDD